MSASERRIATADTLIGDVSRDRSAASSLPSSLVAGRYRVTALLGEGGMGRVYRARDLELDEEVALKMIRPEVLALPGILERFRLEVKLARRVTHPHVARTFDIGEHAGERFLTMEFVEGESLAQILARCGPMAPARVIEIGTALCAGMAAAHGAGVIHRDLKPDNVIVAQDGRVVITDFGVARARRDAASESSAGQLVGTPAYMAPEQFLGDAEIDARADLFAFGAILFELLTGRPAYVGASLQEIAMARLSGQPPSPADFRPEIPELLAHVVSRSMSLDREHRFATANDTMIALIEARAELFAHAGLSSEQKEPLSRRLTATAFRRAALERWGSAGVHEIETRLPAETRRALEPDAMASSEWIPLRHIIAWCFAAWQGPARCDREEMAAYVRRHFDLGSGVIRRFILHLARPEDVLGRMGKLWRQDNTHGDLTVEIHEKHAVARITGTPLLDSWEGRETLAEIYRYAISLTRAKEVTETHALEAEGVLAIWLHWK